MASSITFSDSQNASIAGYSGTTYSVTVGVGSSYNYASSISLNFSISPNQSLKSGDSLGYLVSIQFGNFYATGDGTDLTGTIVTGLSTTAPYVIDNAVYDGNNTPLPVIQSWGSGSSLTIQLASSLVSSLVTKFTNTKTIPITIKLYGVQWTNANEYTRPVVGTLTSQIYLTESAFAPTFNFTASTAVNNPWNTSLYTGISKQNFSISSLSLKFGASVESYNITFNGQSSSTTTLNATTVANPGSYTATATIIDSRGFSAQKTLAYEYIAYSKPTIVASMVTRTDANGAASDEGLYAHWKSVFSYDSVGGENSASYSISYKGSNDNSFTEVSSGDLSTTETEIEQTTSETFNTEESYLFRFSLSDDVSTVTKELTLDQAFFTMDFLKGGKGIAFGCTSTKEGFECGMEAYFNKKLNIPANQRIWINNKRTLERVFISSDNTKPYFKIATSGVRTTNYNDCTGTYLVSQHYNGGSWAIIRCSLRTNDQSSTASDYAYSAGELEFLVNAGFASDAFQLKVRNSKANNLADLYYKSNAAYASLTIIDIDNGSRSNFGDGFTLISDYLTAANDGLADMNADTYTNTVSCSNSGTVAYSNNSDTVDGIHASGFIKTALANGYYGMARPSDGDTTDYIRTTGNGLIPYASGKPGTGSLGTDGWRFNNGYIYNIYGRNYTSPMTDYVVASGTSGDWKYWKFASKLAICYLTRTDDLYTDTSATPCYSEEMPQRNYPFTFASKPAVIMGVNGKTAQFWVGQSADGSTTKSPKWRLYAGSIQSSVSCMWSILAIGTWA